MTCVVVVVGTTSEGKKVIMIGADRAVSWNDSIEVKKSPKIVKKENKGGQTVLLGNDGDVRRINLLMNMDIPEHEVDTSLDVYLAKEFVGKVVETLPGHFDGELLLGIEGRIFLVYNGYGIIEPTNDATAIGSGRRYALGSLFSTRALSLPLERRVELALEAASEYAESVRPPFDIISHIF